MTKEEIFHVIKKNVIEILDDVPPEAITIDKRLKDLGANSVDRVEVVTMTLEDLSIKIPLVEFGSIKDLQGLVNFLYEKAA